MVAKTKTKPKTKPQTKAFLPIKAKPSTQAQTQLKDMSYKQLVDLRRRIDEMLTERQATEKTALKLKMQALAESSGFKIEDLVDGRSGAKSARSKVAPKYCNPADKSQTWTGRGRKPLWLGAELESGKTLESFLIK